MIVRTQGESADSMDLYLLVFTPVREIEGAPVPRCIEIQSLSADQAVPISTFSGQLTPGMGKTSVVIGLGAWFLAREMGNAANTSSVSGGARDNQATCNKHSSKVQNNCGALFSRAAGATKRERVSKHIVLSVDQVFFALRGISLN